jgi:hypothetical protein
MTTQTNTAPYDYDKLVEESKAKAALLLRPENCDVPALHARYSRAVLLGHQLPWLGVDDQTPMSKDAGSALGRAMALDVASAYAGELPARGVSQWHVVEHGSFRFSMYVKYLHSGKWLSLDSISVSCDETVSIGRGGCVFKNFVQNFVTEVQDKNAPTIITVENICTREMTTAAEKAGFRIFTDKYNVWADLQIPQKGNE